MSRRYVRVLVLHFVVSRARARFFSLERKAPVFLSLLSFAAFIAAQSQSADLPPFVNPFIVWTLVSVVLGFGLAAGIAWLHGRASALAKTNPAASAVMDAVANDLAAVQKVIGNGAGAPELAQLVDSFFHAHAVVMGAPHADDPRAPS